MSRVVHRPVGDPNPPVTVNLHRAAGNWATNRARARDTVDWEDWRDRAQAIRADAVSSLPELLAQLVAQVEQAGGVVHRAATASEARALVVGLCAERGLRSAVKAKSMLTEEIGLNPALVEAGIDVVETDLGEYIVQLLEDRPSHILAPAVHLSAVQVAKLFGDMDPEDTGALVGHARTVLRQKFLDADVGITGVNFAVAETGTLILVESEGNIRLSSGLPRVHIALMGIEKVVRDWEGAGHLVQMLPLAAHGRPTATYTSYITGVSPEGPDELHLILVDDGRSDLVGTELESVLHCIRCGACLYACPVYRQIGGHNYGTAYSGPIGAVLTPALEPGSEDLAWLSSLCGACTEACPVKIPLDEQLIMIRRRDASARGFWEAWARLWSKPAGYRATALTGGKAFGRFTWMKRAPWPLNAWTETRDAKAPAAVPFRERWRKTRGP